jgi:protein phosphatase
MTHFDPAQIESAGLTDVGQMRTSNQDALGEFRSPASRLLIVADGMGGHRGGQTASRVAVETIEQVFRSAEGAPGQVLRSAFEAANERVHGMASQDPELLGMGTTGVALLFTGSEQAWVAHVGDSRAYRMRNGALERLTQDHSVVEELQRRGIVTPEEAAVHPRRNEILRSIGVEPDVEVELQCVLVEPGDLFLLCSDGLSGVLSDQEIADVLAREEPDRAVRTLVALANARGGPDNVTVQIARVPGGVDPTDVPTRALTAPEIPVTPKATAQAGGAPEAAWLQTLSWVAVLVGSALVLLLLWRALQ